MQKSRKWKIAIRLRKLALCKSGGRNKKHSVQNSEPNSDWENNTSKPGRYIYLKEIHF